MEALYLIGSFAATMKSQSSNRLFRPLMSVSSKRKSAFLLVSYTINLYEISYLNAQ